MRNTWKQMNEWQGNLLIFWNLLESRFKAVSLICTRRLYVKSIYDRYSWGGPIPSVSRKQLVINPFVIFMEYFCFIGDILFLIIKNIYRERSESSKYLSSGIRNWLNFFKSKFKLKDIDNEPKRSQNKFKHIKSNFANLKLRGAALKLKKLGP